jgi:hypothetical protein
VRRATLDQVAGRKTPVQGLRLPPAGEDIWTAFWRIEQSRQGGMGPQAFAYAEIEAWSRLSRHDLAPWEVEAIMDMDVARRNAWAESKPENGERPPGVRRLVSFRNVEAAERMFDRFGEVRDA